MLGAASRLIAAMLPGAKFMDSLCGRSHRSGWRIEKLFDRVMGKGHCAEQYDWEYEARKIGL